MKKRTSKVLFGIFGSLLVITGVVAIGVSLVKTQPIKKQPKSTIETLPDKKSTPVTTKEKIVKNNVTYTHENVFPKLEKDDYYKYVRYDYKTKEPFLSKEIIFQIVKDLITKINVSGGQIRWNFEQKSHKHVLVYISWVFNNEKMDKTYEINLSQ